MKEHVMIYTVESNYTDPSTLKKWGDWYETYLRRLVLLSGLDTAQRFRAIEKTNSSWEYLAIYTVPNLDVYKTNAYHAIGGGGNASKAFHHAITRRRNVYNGIDRMPEVPVSHRLLFSEGWPNTLCIPGILFVPLNVGAHKQKAGATRFDGQPERRGIALVDADTVEGLQLIKFDKFTIYVPITKYFS